MSLDVNISMIEAMVQWWWSYHVRKEYTIKLLSNLVSLYL